MKGMQKASLLGLRVRSSLAVQPQGLFRLAQFDGAKHDALVLEHTSISPSDSASH